MVLLIGKTIFFALEIVMINSYGRMANSHCKLLLP